MVMYMIRRNITITDEQDIFLKKNESINISEHIRDLINKIMFKKVNGENLSPEFINSLTHEKIIK